jgi:hypothetical protein
MSPLPKSIRVATLLAACGVLAACASTQPVPYAGIASSGQMQPRSHDETGHIPYEYKSAADLRAYSKFSVDTVAIYRGADGQFEDVSEQDKNELARYMQTVFADKLAALSRNGADAHARALRIKLTLTGAKENTPVLSTLSRFDLLGGPYNAVQAARGKEGALTGSVSFAVEIHDASTNELLAAYVSKEYPNAWNLGASMGALSASKTGIDKGADELVAYLARH